MWLLRRETWSQGSQGGIFQLPEVHLGVQVGKFDPQDIYVGEQVQLLSGQSATVLEVSIRALFSGLQILSQVVPETYYSVAFDDGTFCDNHDPEEVKYDEGVELTINTEVCSTSQTVCTVEVCLRKCSQVRVMWEGDWCTGLFKGSNTLLWYRVGSWKN